MTESATYKHPEALAFIVASAEGDGQYRFGPVEPTLDLARKKQRRGPKGTIILRVKMTILGEIT
jgi:hypothetical protein